MIEEDDLITEFDR